MSMQPTASTETAEIAPLRDRLRRAVPAAMKARDRQAVAALRSALAAIENAEAVDVGRDDKRARTGAIEASPVGAGAAEVARRVLSEAEVLAIVQNEIAERRDAAAAYESAGHAGRAADLVAEADTLAAYVGDAATFA